MDSGDTAWVLISTALILFMTPGLAFFYARHGPFEERARHAHAELLRDGADLGVCGRSSASRSRSEATGPIVGDFEFAWLSNVSRSRRVDSGHGLRRLPDDVRRHHAGADHREQPLIASSSAATHCLIGVWSILVYATDRPLGVQFQRLDLRRRAPSTSPVAPPSTSTPASPPSQWSLVIGKRQGPRYRTDAAPQPAADHARHRHLVVRLDRVQCRLARWPLMASPRRRW